MAGTHRVAGGSLDVSAGRIVELDELAKKYVAATTEAEREGVFEQVAKVVGGLESRYPPCGPPLWSLSQWFPSRSRLRELVCDLNWFAT